MMKTLSHLREGETCHSMPSVEALTKYQFTGQYSYESDFGLQFYNARFYDSAIGRFVSADSIVPPGVQGLDRYAYTINNPVIYTDPSGHSPEDCGGRSGYRCQIHMNHVQNENNQLEKSPDNLNSSQIMQLLGFTNVGDLTDWYESNELHANFIDLLGVAKIGDVISLQFGERPYNFLMIVRSGRGIAFYDIESRQLLDTKDISSFKANSAKYVKGAGILRDEDMNGVYGLPSLGHQFGLNFSGHRYTFPSGWNKASDGKGRVHMQKNYTAEQIGMLSSSILGVLGGPVGGPSAAIADFSIVMNPSSLTPIYYPQSPVPVH